MRRSRRRLRVRTTTVFASILITVFVTILVVGGFASAGGGNDAAGVHPPVGIDTVPPAVLDGGPVVDATRTPVTSAGLPAKTIALTFDDGPDPIWTPEVLAILRKYDIPATFFVVGSNVSRYPDIVRDIHASGSELGVHTFSHPDLVNVSRWRLDRELAETQLAIAGSAGVTTYLLRPPYSASAAAIDNLGYTTVQAAGQDGYICVFTTADSLDWQLPGVPAVVRNATPAPDADAGSVVLMHDAGGDRSETVAALDTYIPAMKAAGFRFTTVTGGLGRPPANVAASSRDQLMGSILLGTLSVATTVVKALAWVLLLVGVLVVLRLLLMVTAARRHARLRRSPDFTWGPAVDWPVSVIVPAYNEAKNIEATVRSILANDHPLEVVVVDDGSTDGTADLVEGLQLDRVRVIRQANAGKPVALNTGVRAAQHGLVIMIDGDTIFEPDTVRLLVQPFADPSVGAVAGNVKIANRDALIGRLQHIEYVVGFNIDRRVQDAHGSIATIPGAAGAFRRQALLDVGGLTTDTLAEDTDVTIALGRAGWRVVFEDRARAWTEAPATVSQLWRQRFRWSYGTMQAIWKHRGAMRERGTSGQLGRRGLAHVAVFHILLPLTAPLVDIGFVYGLLFADPAATLLLWLVMLLLQLAGALYAFHLEGETKGALWVLPVQQVIYRQLMYLVLVQSIISAVTGARVRWQQMHRIGVLGELLPGVNAAATPMTRRASVPVPAARSATAAPAAQRPPGPQRRENWLDVLRVAALSRVVAYNAVGIGWMTLIFPSLGVMFAIGGSLMVASMRRTPAIDVIGHRLRRLLLPLWLLGAVLVPLMLWQGWASDSVDNPFHPQNLLFWVFPVLDPPGNTWAEGITTVLWYVRAYLWFVLLTPLMLGAYRRWPVLATLAPLLVVAIDSGLNLGVEYGSGFGRVLIDFCTFATCWMLGFAHRDGTLRRMRPQVLTGLAVAAIAAGGAWTWFHPSPVDGYDLTEIPLGQALISAGVVLVLLRFSPKIAWLGRVPVLGRLITIINARVITIYLTHSAAIVAAPTVIALLGWESAGALVGTAVGLTVLVVLVLGWVEDLAARRPLQIIPGGRRARQARNAAASRPAVPFLVSASASAPNDAAPATEEIPRQAPIPQQRAAPQRPRQPRAVATGRGPADRIPAPRTAPPVIPAQPPRTAAPRTPAPRTPAPRTPAPRIPAPRVPTRQSVAPPATPPTTPIPIMPLPVRVAPEPAPAGGRHSRRDDDWETGAPLQESHFPAMTLQESGFPATGRNR
ncbi:glycosyltransferase [Pseudonocardia sp. GCM10023141]|uniref:glycosyltransferase n=1 Tax=Pseudonocardia sp. GCM10023141 TaxID=3252653 RepID=UPI0036190FF0